MMYTAAQNCRSAATSRASTVAVWTLERSRKNKNKKDVLTAWTVLTSLTAVQRRRSGTQVFKIVDPYFLNATGAALVCLIYPTDAYDEEEADMKANPAAFGRALVCEHARVLSWLGFVTADIEEGAGSGAEAARPAPEAVCAHAPRCAATLGM